MIHNLKTNGPQQGAKGGWYLAVNGYFMNAGKDGFQPRDGWSPADRWSFHEWLMGWDYVDVANLP